MNASRSQHPNSMLYCFGLLTQVGRFPCMYKAPAQEVASVVSTVAQALRYVVAVCMQS
jgi:hypothetical protein